jgi:hypothetical protein
MYTTTTKMLTFVVVDVVVDVHVVVFVDVDVIGFGILHK